VDTNYRFTDRHLFIAGTGRAGTSFLVRYLSELGLDTHLDRHAEPAWDENANAGLEDVPFLGTREDLPYVIKSPWLYEFIDSLIDNGTFNPDGVIIPVRDLAEAAISRSVLERRSIHQTAPWMCELDSAWEQWGHVPGGIIYSLNPVDQGRLLAVGFHHLVQRLIAADIPTIFLSFPRLVEDSDYLFGKLRPLLPPGIDDAAAGAAHKRIVDTTKVRVSGEVNATRHPASSRTAKVVQYASHAELDAIAVQREIGRLRQQLGKAQQEAADLTERLRANTAAAAEERQRQSETIGRMDTTLANMIAEQEQAGRDRDAARVEAAALRERLRDAEQVLHHSGQAMRHAQEAMRYSEQTMSDRIVSLQEQSALEQHRRVALEDAIAGIHASRSWKLTRPYRAIGFVAQWLLRKKPR
jgi:hypothetical protein